MKKLLLLILLIIPTLIMAQQAEEIYKVVEEMPRFPGCEETKMSSPEIEACAKEQLLQYIYSNLKYPEAARNNKVEGMVVIQFVVDTDGSIDNAKIVRDIGSGAGEAALEVVDAMNQMSQTDTTVTFYEESYTEEVKVKTTDIKWRPGYQDGKPVKVLYTLPVRYKLSDESSEEENVNGRSVVNNIIIDNENKSEEIFKVVDEMPRFPGCEDMEGTDEEKRLCSNQKMLQFIYKNLKYPEAARNNKVEGMVVIQFVVDTDGSIDNAKIVRDIGSGAGEAALEVVDAMNQMSQTDTTVTFYEESYTEEVKVKTTDIKWRPGYQDGKPVKVLYTLPVRYKLQDEENSDKESALQSDAEELNWEIHPPEYRSYQAYKDAVLIPSQVKIAYQVEPIETSKIIGDVIPFGETMHPILRVKAKHNGIDFRAVPGVTVMATAGGQVSLVSLDHEKYGQYIKIKHNDRTESLYAHLSEIKVTEGQLIEAGQEIGAVGMSGTATYPHLHYEVLVERQTVDPQLDRLDRINAIEPMEYPNLQMSKSITPLFVVDGTERDATFSIEQIDPDDIAELYVIKGIKAIEKYGERATDGVVEITTKSHDSESPSAALEIAEPAAFALDQNYPNPVIDQTTITFNLPTAAPASLYFYNQAGEFVYSLNEGFNMGINEINISASELKSNGVIYYFLIQGHMTAAKQMVVAQ